jgi:hypothetical protein
MVLRMARIYDMGSAGLFYSLSYDGSSLNEVGDSLRKTLERIEIVASIPGGLLSWHFGGN